MARIKATGVRHGERVVMECDDQGERIKTFKNGELDISFDLEVLMIQANKMRSEIPHLAELETDSLCSYCHVLRNLYFDEPPEFEGDATYKCDDCYELHGYPEGVVFYGGEQC